MATLRIVISTTNNYEWTYFNNRVDIPISNEAYESLLKSFNSKEFDQKNITAYFLAENQEASVLLIDNDENITGGINGMCAVETRKNQSVYLDDTEA